MKLILLALAALLVGPVLVTAQTTENVDIVVTHGASCAGGPIISTDNSTPTAGSTVHVTVSCGPGNPKDYVQLAIDVNRESFNPYIYMNGATSGTFQFTAPNVASDRPVSYVALLYCCDSFQLLATSAPFVVPATINPPVPTQSLPAALAADPFVPSHTITVCASGCNYTALGNATDAAFDAGWDNVLIKISAGDYPFPAHALSNRYPPHLWIKGISSDGVTFPHIYGVTNTSGSIMGSTQYFTPGQASLTLDNLELGPWNYWTMKAQDATQWTLRNDYVHDTTQGLISGNSAHLVLNIYNSVFSRNGGADGPEHDVYVGEGDNANIVRVKNSVFEQAFLGHSFKERAQTFNASCSMFLVNQDNVYQGSETLDMDSAQPILTNILSVNGGGSTLAWTNNSSWDNLRYGVDNEVTYPVNYPTITGSTFLADQPNSIHDFATLGIRFTTTPTAWSNNKFVWPDTASRTPGPGGSGGVYDSTGALYAEHTGDTNDVALDGSNSYFIGRTAAGLPPVGSYPKGWRDFLPLMPAACTDPVGLVKIPAS
jgi:hypothetical protein